MVRIYGFIIISYVNPDNKSEIINKIYQISRPTNKENVYINVRGGNAGLSRVGYMTYNESNQQPTLTFISETKSKK